jgi:16S rRNA (guanine966-N2)-methyltransferase
VRIVGGEFRGRALVAPDSREIRPTADRVRQTLFDILAHSYGDPVRGGRVLDLFAGTGALGIEAISRGAGFALFIDEGAEARGLIRDNVQAFGLTGRTRIFRRDATRLGEAGTVAPFDVVVADPPYGRGLGEQALAAALAGGWLKPDTVAVLEEDAAVEVKPVAGLEMREIRRIGDTQVVFMTPVNLAADASRP